MAEAGALAVRQPVRRRRHVRLAGAVRGAGLAVASAGTAGVGYWAWGAGDAGIAVALAVVAGAFGVGALRSR